MVKENQSEQPSRTLERDPIWEGFLHNSFEYFQHLVNGMSFHPEVDDDVVKRFDPVKKAVLYSYFEYQLLEPAYDRALLAFEMALRRRYREMHSEAERLDNKAPGEPYTLQQLIDWADDEHLFEDIKQRATPGKDDRNEEHIAHALRDQRNRVAHPQRHNQLGVLALQGIRRVVENINHVYRDPSSRRKRHEHLQEARKRFDGAFKNSGVLEGPPGLFGAEGEPRFLIYKASVLYCEGHDGDLITHFAFQPIFDPESGPGDGFSKTDPVVVPVTSFSISADSVILEDTKGRNWTLSPVEKQENREKYSKWREKIGDDYEIACMVAESEFGSIRTDLRSPSRQG
jgi:hypothetical protein